MGPDYIACPFLSRLLMNEQTYTHEDINRAMDEGRDAELARVAPRILELKRALTTALAERDAALARAEMLQASLRETKEHLDSLKALLRHNK